MIGRDKKGGFIVTVKIEGSHLKYLLEIRAEKEKEMGGIMTIAELVREAIEYWYNGRGNE